MEASAGEEAIEIVLRTNKYLVSRRGYCKARCRDGTGGAGRNRGRMPMAAPWRL